MLLRHRNVLGTCSGLRFIFRKYSSTMRKGVSKRSRAAHHGSRML